MKKHLTALFIAMFALIACLTGTPFTVRVSAATPAAAKKKVTLYTDSPKYMIELKNVKSGAKITYKTSDESVVTVKKGKVTPVGVGKATVTVKIKQKKTYTIKITFTVKESIKEEEPALDAEDYDADVIDKLNRISLFDNELAIKKALEDDDASALNESTKMLYDRVISLAKQLKGKTEYDTVKNIHDYIVLNTQYPSSYSGDGVHSLNYALNKGVCVCDGYSKAFYFLCKANGIEAVIMNGQTTNAAYGEAHAWNKVKINGKWYSLDVTWDDPIGNASDKVKYNYFLIKDSDLKTDHSWDDTGVPDAVSDDLGTIYEMYKDYPKYEKNTDAIKYIKKQISRYVSEKKKGTELVLNVLVRDDYKEFIETLKAILNDCYTNYKCGYNYSGESAGFYGMKYYIKIYY